MAGKDRCQWSDIAARFDQDPFQVSHAPGFSFDADSRFFCLGSCFGRNIEEHLIYRGIDVLSKRVVSPKTEWPARANGFLNKFTTDAMLNELRWLEHPPEDVTRGMLETSARWRDMQLLVDERLDATPGDHEVRRMSQTGW